MLKKFPVDKYNYNINNNNWFMNLMVDEIINK